MRPRAYMKRLAPLLMQFGCEIAPKFLRNRVFVEQ